MRSHRVITKAVVCSSFWSSLPSRISRRRPVAARVIMAVMIVRIPAVGTWHLLLLTASA